MAAVKQQSLDLQTQPVENVLDFGDKLPGLYRLLLKLAFAEYFPEINNEIINWFHHTGNLKKIIWFYNTGNRLYWYPKTSNLIEIKCIANQV